MYPMGVWLGCSVQAAKIASAISTLAHRRTRVSMAVESPPSSELGGRTEATTRSSPARGISVGARMWYSADSRAGSLPRLPTTAIECSARLPWVTTDDSRGLLRFIATRQTRETPIFRIRVSTFSPLAPEDLFGR